MSTFLIDRLLKLIFRLFERKLLDVSIASLRFVQTVSEYTEYKYTSLFYWSVRNVNHIVNKLQLFLHFFGRCCNLYSRQNVVSARIICCRDQPSPQPCELVEIWVSQHNLLGQAKVSCCLFRTLYVLHSNILSQFRTMKIILTFCELFQSPHSW